MRKTKLWNDETWQAMFIHIQSIEVNGKIVDSFPNSFKPGCKHFSSKEKEEIMKKLYQRLLDKEVFTNERKPKSHLAIFNQLNWALTTSKASLSGKGCQKMCNHLRLIAYGTGFLSMNDILWLENNTR